MPYEVMKETEIRASGTHENFVIVNDEGEIVATHQPPDAKEKADRQCKLLNEIDKDPEWDKEDDDNA